MRLDMGNLTLMADNMGLWAKEGSDQYLRIAPIQDICALTLRLLYGIIELSGPRLGSVNCL